jgi:MFS family permease
MINYSIIFLALQWFDSHALAGLGYGLCFGPPLILGWFAGVYCDRYSPRRVILVAQNSFIVSLLLLYLAFNVDLESRQVYLLASALFAGIGWSFVAPARFATLAFYVAKDKLTGAAIGLNLMVMAGFGLAPMLLKQLQLHFDWQMALLVAGALLLLSSLLLLPLRFEFKPKAGSETIKEIKSSLAFVKDSAPVSQLLLLSAIAYLLMGPMQVLLPTIASKTLLLDEAGQGNYLSLIAVALIVGGLVAMGLKNKGKVGHRLMVAIGLAAGGLALLAVESRLGLSVALLAGASMCAGIGISFIVAGLQGFSCDLHRGRVMSFYSIISQFIPALSGVVAGLLAQVFEPPMALQLMAGFIVMSVVACWLRLSIRKLERFDYVGAV